MTTEKISRQCMQEEMRIHDVHVFEPKSKKETVMAEGLEVFSSFVLDEEKELTLTILEKHLGRSVGVVEVFTAKQKIPALSLFTLCKIALLLCGKRGFLDVTCLLFLLLRSRNTIC